MGYGICDGAHLVEFQRNQRETDWAPDWERGLPLAIPRPEGRRRYMTGFGRKKRAGDTKIQTFPPFLVPDFPFSGILLIQFFIPIFGKQFILLNWSKSPSSEGPRPAADEWKHQFQFIFQYQWISARSMALVSMFLCNQSYASHGRDFLLWATILNSTSSDIP